MFKKLLENKKAVCFDLDGTVINSLPIWNSVIESIAYTFGVFKIDFENYSGYSLSDIWADIIKNNQIDSHLNVLELVKSTNAEFLQRVGELEITNGFWELAAHLKTEKNLKLALVTNSSSDITNKISETLMFGKTFDVVVTGDQVKSRKPSPEIYNLAAKKVGVKTKQILAFEDSIPGVNSAINAGASVAVIWDYVHPKYDYPEKVEGFFEDFSWLLGNLDDTIGDRFEDYVKRLEALEKDRALQSKSEVGTKTS